MKRHWLWVLALISLMGNVPSASAQLIYEFADSTGVAQTSFTVLQGSTVNIRVYIHELTSGAPTLNSQGGLGTGAVRVRFNNPANIAAVLTAADISAAPSPWAFGTVGIGSGANANSATIANASNLGAGVLPDLAGRILLGTFTFHALAEGAVTLAAVDPNTAGFDTSSFNTTAGVPNINYDPLLVAGAATLNVTQVPEPTSLLLLGMAAIGYRRGRAYGAGRRNSPFRG